MKLLRPMRILRLIPTKVLVLVLSQYGFGSTSAQAETTSLDFSHCSMSQAILEAGAQDICRDATGKILFELQNGVAWGSIKLGDLTPLFNLLGRDKDETPQYTIDLIPFQWVPGIFQTQFKSLEGDILNTTFTHFVWSRNFALYNRPNNPYPVSFNPTRTIKCFNSSHDPVTHDNGCITYYTANVCDSWHNRHDQPGTPLVQWPTIAARTKTFEDALFMMEHFEYVQRTAEILLQDILHISCGK